MYSQEIFLTLSFNITQPYEPTAHTRPDPALQLRY